MCRDTSRRCLALAVFLVAAGVAGRGFANGRFPQAHRLVEDPSNPNRLFLGATYGLVETEDRGKSWYAICEQAFALQYTEGDPQLEIMTDGSVVGGIFESLNRSTDCGCTWQTVLAGGEEAVVDITVAKSTGAVLALLQDVATGKTRFSVHESTDKGKTWRKLSDLPGEVTSAFTIDVAPSDPSRVYVSGVPVAVPDVATDGLLVVSTDHGATWQTRALTGATTEALPYIAAVDPTNADRLFVRTHEWMDGGDYSANDALLVSADAGKTWREVLRRSAKMLGFAISPDGSTVLAGYGDPIEPWGHTVNPEDFGIYKASVSSLTFEKIYSKGISCLSWTAAGVYACVIQKHPEVPAPELAVGVAPNADFTETTANPFTPIMKEENIRGPLSCNASTCLGNWKTGVGTSIALCERLGATCDVNADMNQVSCSTGTGGTGGGGGDGSGGDGGCACSSAPTQERGVAAGFLLLLVLAGSHRRLRRRDKPRFES